MNTIKHFIYNISNSEAAVSYFRSQSDINIIVSAASGQPWYLCEAHLTAEADTAVC